MDHGFAEARAAYDVAWHRFDNATGESARIGASRSDGRAAMTGTIRMKPEAALPEADGAFVRVDISAADPAHPAWSEPVHAYFRRGAAEWKLVGFDRMPTAPLMRPGLVGAEKK